MSLELHSENIRCYQLSSDYRGYELVLNVAPSDNLDKFIKFLDDNECVEITHTLRVYHDPDVVEVVTFRDFIATVDN